MDETRYYNPDELRTKEYNRFIDDLLQTGKVDSGTFAHLTPVQRDCYSVINRAFERIKSKQ